MTMHKQLTHLSLFSGVGGLDIAAEAAGFVTVGQCEFANYPTRILEKHWPDVPRWRDVKDLNAESFRRRTGLETVVCISGGFPCQPHSLAGKRQASADEHDLWPEYRRNIGEIKPRWVVAENVLGLLSSEDGRFFRGILRDLSELGFDVGWCAYPASWVGAIHRRERVFTVAHYRGERRERVCEKPICRQLALSWCEDVGGPEKWAERCNLFTPKLCGTGDGVANKVDRLRCLGNMVVPQQAYPIFAAIAEIENNKP